MIIAKPRVRIMVVVVAVLGSVGLIAAAGLDDSLVYYRSPSEVNRDPVEADRIRLGGLVQAGSVASEGANVRFVLTDGVDAVTVVHEGDPPGVFQEGQGALVEGTFDADGLFRSDLLIVKHSNEYQAPASGEMMP